MKRKNASLLFGIVACGLICGHPAVVHADEPVPGTPGVATRRAVVNFAELANHTASSAASPAEAIPDAPVGFAPASPGLVPPSPAPASSFLALLGDGELVDKPDTQGAVGPSHLMVALNTSVRIQDRSGEVISTVTLSNFWGSLGPFNVHYFEGLPYDGVFDPKLLYDPYANRFILVTLANQAAADSALLIGVSQTSDPTGNWNLYRYDADASNVTFIDYPFIGFNKHWIAVQTIMFNNSNNSFNRVHIYAFNKTDLYAGGDGAFTLFSRSDIGFFQTPAVTFDTNVSTLYLLQQLGEHNNTSLNSLRIFTITGSVGSEVFTTGPTVTSTNLWAFNAPSGFNSNFHPQLGSTRRIYSKGANIYTLSYRNGSLWAAQTIYLPFGGAATRSAVQWWEISPAGSIIQRGLIDDPSGLHSFDYPSLAVNQFNDVLIGYNRFSSNQYASANYSFRAGNDPPNTMRTDTVLKEGEAPVDFVFPTYPVNSWGDYSATMVDPVNDTDLWTIQEYASTNLGGFGGGDNWGTWWGHIVPPSNLGIASVTVTEGDTETSNALVYVSLPRPTDQPVSVDFATTIGTALDGLDFVVTNGTVCFQPGETSQTISVGVLPDLLDEATETLFIRLSNPTNMALAYTDWPVIILDNDPPPALSINDINVAEGDVGLTGATFTLSLSAPSGQPISVRVQTANGTAVLRADYAPTNIVVSILTGATSQPVTIQMISDTIIESNETFRLNLLSPTNATLADSQGICTILDDDFKVTSVELTGGDVRLSFTTRSNQTYRVERTESLAAPVVWEPVTGATDVPGTGTVVSVLDFDAASRPQLFYRVRSN